MNTGKACRAVLFSALLGASACTSRPAAQDADLDALATLARQVDPERLMSRVQTLADAHQQDVKLECSSTAKDPALCNLSHDQASGLMRQWLASAGLEVQQDTVTDQGITTSNVIAELRGTTHPEQVVLVGAHFDSFYQGADDNSTGVAAVAELAEVLSQFKFERTLRFVGFDLEELGDMGSTRYLNAHAGEDIQLAVVFDCIGFYSSAPGSQQSLPGFPAPSQGDFLADIANDRSSAEGSELYALSKALDVMKVVPIIAPGDGVSFIGGTLMRSDHAPFWLEGRKALFLTDTASLRNPNYHHSTDTVDTLDPAGFAGAVRISAAGIAYWAGGPR